MYGSRVGGNLQVAYPSLRLENDMFDFVRSLEVGDKGVLNFSAIVKSHHKDRYLGNSEEDIEYKRIKITNLSMLGRKNARMT